jgi:hypothetical protein
MVLAGVIGVTLGVSDALGQGIGYEVAPVAAHVRWHEALGFQDDYLFGGRLGLRFGQLAELNGYYLTRDNLQADATDLPGLPGFVPPIPEQQLRVQNYGANLRLNLSTGTLVPYLSAGGGVLRLDPEQADPTEQILFNAGAGLRFRLAGRIAGEVFAENWAFRLNRLLLFPPLGGIEDPEADELRHNLALGAALTIPLGGDPAAPAPGLLGTALSFEPLAGRLDFADELNLARQNLLGARAGIDLNRLVGVRAFYWRGMNDEFNRAEAIQGYGGEAQFNLGTGQGVIPFLLFGASQIEFREGYTDLTGAPRSNETALILGGGVSIALAERVRVNAGVRDYILSEQDLDEVRRTDQLVHSLHLSAGLSFAVGGRSPAVVLPDERARAEVERLRAENERLRQLAAAERVVIEVDPVTGETIAQRVEPIDPETAATPRTMVVPVPARGEIYIRFGEPGALAAAGALAVPGVTPGTDLARLSPTELRALIRDAVREEMLLGARAPGLPAAPLAGLTEEQRLDLLERRMTQRIDDLLSRRLLEQERRLAQQPQPIIVAPPAVIQDPRFPRVVAPVAERHRLYPRSTRPYTGAGFGGGTQFLFGGRVDLGRFDPYIPLNVVPEAALGFGGEATSFLLAANVQFDFLPPDAFTRFAPYVTSGISVWHHGRTDLGLNLGYGVSVLAVNVPTGPLRIFLEHQGVGLFDRNRLLLGMQVQF